ncbi:MAG: hypothetical protein COT90_04325 [Candidatus Diapherotrites archaeon CG10_big_fil_rev_8_21_14_0_10_31_34]|nr:MAG: hypothetical protein COT90_04325 [Candidatus Diapherotrites archaeon CG10_big_fil_rev_8_21_14_0_10_31_34]PJA19157.1 MAG: hypothetical protein COX63_01750 [Candidatus Diapherotrites archaeon CG_4_10_14_0_2_um_filter_31_5]
MPGNKIKSVRKIRGIRKASHYTNRNTAIQELIHAKKTLDNPIAPIKERLKVINLIKTTKSFAVKKRFFQSLFFLLASEKDHRLRLAAAEAVLKMRLSGSFRIVANLALKEAKKESFLKDTLAEQVIYQAKNSIDALSLIKLIKEYPKEEIKLMAAEHLLFIASPEQKEKILKIINSVNKTKFYSSQWNVLIQDMQGTINSFKVGRTSKK